MLMMSYGMPTLIETGSVSACARMCRELGLGFVELNLNFPQFLLQKLDARQLRQEAQANGIGYTIHLDDEMSIADFNPYIAQGYCRTVIEAVELAKQIGAKKLNMHMSRGAKYTLPDRVIYFFEAYREDYLRNIRTFRDACQEAVGDSGILICVENTNGFLPFQKEAMEILLESPVFALTFDIGHNYCAGNMDEAWILEHKDRLSHFHIHDARDGSKDHRELGSGELDIARYLKLAQELNCTAVLETKTAASLADSARWIKAWKENGQ